jgi:hypothetical protein
VIALWPEKVLTTEVPDLTGRTVREAESALEAAALRRGETVDQQTGRPVASGTVVDQSPQAGEEVEQGRAVKLVVEVAPARVPDVTGKREAEARRILEADGAKVKIERRPSREAAEGTVIGQDPGPGSPFQKRDTVTLAVAEAAKPIDLTGVWNSNDQGRCYLRQSGARVFWYCERATKDPRWSNVFEGALKGDMLQGDWIDVPKGRTGGKGTLLLLVAPSGDEMTAVERTGGYGGSKWTRAR